MLASLTDRTLAMKKELGEIHKSVKQLEDKLQPQIEQNKKGINELKIKVVDLTRKVTSNAHFSQSPSASNMPGKLQFHNF